MSLHDKCLWMPTGPDCLSEDTTGLGTSSNFKRNHQALWNAPDEELLYGRKKQAVESIDLHPIPSNANNSIWDDASGSQSTLTQCGDHLFVPGSLRNFDLADKSISSAGNGNLNMERRGPFEQFENEPAVNLSMSHNMENPLCLNSGLGRANIGEVLNSANSFYMSVGHDHSYVITTNNPGTAFQMSHTNLTVQRAYRKENGYAISHGPSFSCRDSNLIPNGQSFTKSGSEFVLMGNHNTGSHGSHIVHGVYEPRTNYNCSNSLLQDPEHETSVTIASPFAKTAADFKCTDTPDNRHAVITSTVPSNYKEDVTPVSMGVTYGSASMLSMSQSCDNAEGIIISFGDESRDLSCPIMCRSDALSSQSLSQSIVPPVHQGSLALNVNQVPNFAATSKTNGGVKTKESKKIQANNFPSNVKSLLSTGILDGVSVKYVSWSRERNLRGVIKGTGYLCDCSDCKLSKVVNAFEFERHAGCKTKHPNNHIYFENGKTIYSVVQELKNTPQELLFEVVQNVTGSPINQKNFLIWKVSYQAAKRELERIYGKDDM